MMCFALIVNDKQCTNNNIYFPICSSVLSYVKLFMMKPLLNTFI